MELLERYARRYDRTLDTLKKLSAFRLIAGIERPDSGQRPQILSTKLEILDNPK